MAGRSRQLGWFFFGLLCLGIPFCAWADQGRLAEVTADAVDVFEEPSDRSHVIAQFQAGDVIDIYQTLENGWTSIRPPREAFDWIIESDIRVEPDGAAWVEADQVRIRFGRDGAKLPGPPSSTLKRGMRINLVNRPPLTIRRGKTREVWLAIEPPPGEARFVPTSALRVLPNRPSKKSRPIQVDEIRTSLQMPEEGVPGTLAQELSLADALHAASLKDPISMWNLGPVRQRYQELRNQEKTQEGQAILDRRLRKVEVEMSASKAASAFERILSESRARDAEIEAIRKKIASARTLTERGYKARGLLQPSSRRVDGVKVPALINPEGKIIAYLQVPVGLDLPNLYGKRVGVQGSVRFDESLGARLIVVRELDSLEAIP